MSVRPAQIDCRECGTAFSPRRNGGNLQVYCGDSCKVRNDNRLRVQRHPDRVRAWWDKNPGYGARMAEKRKIRVLSAYGSVCACCGEERLPFLTIDHINRDGARHKRELKSLKTSLYSWLVTNGFPTGFRVLCMNCNFATRHGRPCPHQSERVRVTA